MTPSDVNRRLRFSLAVAFGAITVSSVAIVALCNGDWLWARLMFTMTLGLLLAAILAGVYRTGVNRAFWIGFAVFGWAYVMLAFIPSFRVVEHHLPGKAVNSYLKEHAPKASSGTVIDTAGSRIAVFSFAQIVHLVVALIFACVGGLAGVYFYSTSRSRRQEIPD